MNKFLFFEISLTFFLFFRVCKTKDLLVPIAKCIAKGGFVIQLSGEDIWVDWMVLGFVFFE